MTAHDAHNRSAPGDAPAATADALDAWLESITSSRHVERSRDISPNGHGAPEPSLPTAAQQFHGRIARAEVEAQPDVPADAIWEKIMASPTISAALTPNTTNMATRHVERSRDISPRGDNARVVPAWLAGSHWAVSAFMVAAVGVGIVALYGSFAGAPGGPGDDPATNPGFAMASPGETESTPEADIDRWLVAPSTIDCERDSDGAVSSSDWASYRPTDVDDYLPFVPAAASDAETIADRWHHLNANCTPPDDDPIVTDDFGWMPGVGAGIIPADEQIAFAKQLSAALPMQDYESYYIIRGNGSQAGTPDANAEPGGRGVLLPEDIVQLPDRRIGGPLRLAIETNDPNFAITDVTEGYEAAGTVFILFEQVDGRWLYDELITVCVGDCDWFWSEIANPEAVSGTTTYATPAGSTPSATADWLAPTSPEECVVEPRTLDETAALMGDPGETVPREYGPVEPVGDELALDVAQANRVFQSCSLTGDPQEWRAMVSPRLIAEGVGSWQVDTIARDSDSYEEYVATRQTISDMLLTDPARDYLIESTQAQPVLEDGRADYSGSYLFWPVVLPDDIVQLPDGRIGGPELTLIPANHEEIRQAEIDGGITRPTLPYQLVTYRIYAQDPTQNGAWVLDETLTFCASGCDAFYAVAEEFYQSGVSITPATPAASPEATVNWLAPVSPEECNLAETRALEEVGAIVGDTDRAAPREYGPTRDIEESVAQDVAGANRAWESCRAQGLIEQRRAHETLRYVAEVQPLDVLSPGSVSTFEEWVALNETMRDTFLDPAAESYVVESAALPPFDCETASEEADQSGQVFYEVILPQHLVQLPDGRIGGPVTSLVGPGFLQCLEETSPAGTGTSIHIFAQDPTRNNRWALDEQFGICVPGCDAYYEEYAFLYPSSTATPEAATPVTDAAELAPITPEECDVAALSDEEIDATGRASENDTERSYAPTGPVDAALAQDIAEADRAWQSCYVYGSADERAALQSPRLTRDGPGVPPGTARDRNDLLAELERFDATRELGDMMLTHDWRDYLIESDQFVDPITGVVQTVPDFIPTIPVPEQALHLTDGRIAIPIVRLVPPGTYSTDEVDDIPYRYIKVHILAQDPARDGRWVMDEEITLCTGDCDVARTEIVDYIAYADSLVPNADEATPAATPQARRANPAA